MKLTEDDIQVHHTEIPLKNKEFDLTIWTNNYEKGLQLMKQILENEKIVDEIIKSIQKHMKDYDCEWCSEEASGARNIIEEITGKDIKDLTSQEVAKAIKC